MRERFVKQIGSNLGLKVRELWLESGDGETLKKL